MATDDAGDSVGSIGVRAGDGVSDSEIAVDVVDLSANLSATCWRKSERDELLLWNRLGGVPSPLTSFLVWVFSLCVLPDRDSRVGFCDAEI